MYPHTWQICTLYAERTNTLLFSSNAWVHYLLPKSLQFEIDIRMVQLEARVYIVVFTL